MRWYLSHDLYVNCQNQRVYYHNKRYGICISLSVYQFQNLNDVLLSHGVLSPYIPLGNGAWMICTKPYRLFGPRDYIVFHGSSWNIYKRRVHPRIASFLHHEHHVSYHQRHARDDFVRRHRSRASSPPYSQQYVSPRPSSNVSHQNEQQQKPTNVSLWQDSSPRQPFSFRDAFNVLRNHEQDESPISSSQFNSPDFEEYGSICSIEDTCEPT